MSRNTRAFEQWRARRDAPYCLDASKGEKDQRDKAARRLRGRLRQMQPTVLLTPRWSQARGFMEELSMDLY